MRTSLSWLPGADKDGVPDDQDKCPNTPGPVSNNGCPEVSAATKEKLNFAAKSIPFETGKATIKPVSYRMLDEIVGILNEYPDYDLKVEGHTDNKGNAARNLTLSQQRADAVKAYMSAKGINAGRIKAKGYGSERPKVDNKTAVGRSQNRRVEMDLHLKQN